ncbi:MAG: hypothetical protein IJK40_10380, partial [Clostridia bacterium]|nr:hypothetical protein [Clostridia bacterium]
MKMAKRTLSLMLAAILLLTILPYVDVFTKTTAAEIKQRKKVRDCAVGDTFKFGSYPQTQIKDGQLTAQLDKDDGPWISFGYYAGNGKMGSQKPGNWMKYKDVSYMGNRYRG